MGTNEAEMKSGANKNDSDKDQNGSANRASFNGGSKNAVAILDAGSQYLSLIHI